MYEIFMNRKHLILLLLVPCLTTSFSGLCADEATTNLLTVKRITFTSDKDGGERISFFCNQSCAPDLLTLEGDNPRVVMDMKGVLLIQTKVRSVNTKGKLIKRIRNYLDKRTNILRVVLDLDPSKLYIVRPRHNPPQNTYVLIVYEDISLSEQESRRSKDAKGTPLSQEKRITILLPNLRPEEKGPTMTPKATTDGASQKKYVVASPNGLPDLPEAEIRYREALSAQRGGDYKRAEDLYLQTLTHDFGHLRALNNLGVLYMDQKKNELAVALFNKAISLRKDYVDPYYNLACLYARAEEIDESLRYLKMAMDINRDVKNWAEKDADMKSVVASEAFKKIMKGQEN
jgi:tetratricopeptide (TPR) repeat protein